MNKFDLYMKKMGFMKYEASPTDQEKKNTKMLKQMGVEKEDFCYVIYERKLSMFTSFIVEGEYRKGLYYYDFYKIKYHYKTNEISDIKVYYENNLRDQILKEVIRILSYCELIDKDKFREIKIIPRCNFNKLDQRIVDRQRKKKLGIL